MHHSNTLLGENISMMISNDMLEFIDLLKKHNVEYALVGGFAVIYYGYPRSTQDMDVLINPSLRTSKKMMKVLDEFGFGGVGFSAKLFEKEGTAIHLGVEPNRIDILTSIGGVTTSKIFSNVKRIKFEDRVVRIISLPDLIRSKKLSKRYKDLADAEALSVNRRKKNRGR